MTAKSKSVVEYVVPIIGGVVPAIGQYLENPSRDLDNHPPFAALDCEDQMRVKAALANVGLMRDAFRRVDVTGVDPLRRRPG